MNELVNQNQEWIKVHRKLLDSDMWNNLNSDQNNSLINNTNNITNFPEHHHELHKITLSNSKNGLPKFIKIPSLNRVAFR